MRTRLERRRHDYYRNYNLRKKFLHSFSFFFLFSLIFTPNTPQSIISKPPDEFLMNNKQEKTIRRCVFLATTLLAIASPVTVTGLAAQSQKRFCSKEKNKIEDTDGPDTYLEPQEMTG
jgi:hypothetical protein